MQTITIPEDTTIRYEALSFDTKTDAKMTAHVIEERNGFTKALDADGDIFYVRTKSLPGRDSSLYPHPDAPCWACKTVAEADAKMAKIKDHHYNMDVRHRDHHALAMAELRHANTVARLTDKPALAAVEIEVLEAIEAFGAMRRTELKSASRRADWEVDDAVTSLQEAGHIKRTPGRSYRLSPGVTVEQLKGQHSQPACTATEDEVSTDDADTPDTPDTDWTTDPDEIGRTLGIPAPLILPAPHQPAPTKRDQQPKEEAVSHTPAKTSPAVVPSVDPISDMRVVRDADDAPSVIVPSSNGRGEYRVRLAWGFDEHPEPTACTCKHYTCRIAPKVRRSLRYGAEEVFEECKHMRRVRFAILHGHLDGVTPYNLVALAA